MTLSKSVASVATISTDNSSSDTFLHIGNPEGFLFLGVYLQISNLTLIETLKPNIFESNEIPA